MADFVAVIRRAVDGLTDNTPEMRAKVYEKARNAVVRQLENMNPRPPEAMFARQLDKLDAAIQQVEDENSEALPEAPSVDDASEETPAPASAAVEQRPDGQEEPAQQDAGHEEPIQAVATGDIAREEPADTAPPETEPVDPVRDEPAAYADAEPAADQAQSDTATAMEPSEAESGHDRLEPAQPAETEPARHDRPVENDDRHWHDAPAEEHHADVAAMPPEELVPDEPARDSERETDAYSAPADDDPLLSHFEPVREPTIRHAANRVMEEPFVDSASEVPGAEPDEPEARTAAVEGERTVEPDIRRDETASEPTAAMPNWAVDIDREPETMPARQEQAPPMPRAALTETDVANGFNDFLRNEFTPAPVRSEPGKDSEGDFSWDAPFEELPELPKPVAFEQALHARQEEMAKAPEHKAAAPRDPRAELEDLIGYAPAAETADGDEGEIPPDISLRAMSKLEGKSFKVNEKPGRKFNPIPIAFGIIGALVVAGGAYGVYAYRDQVSTLVASYLPADPAPGKNETRAVEDKTADQSKSMDAKTEDIAASQPSDTQTTTTEQPTEVASLDTNIVPTKFTQRLMADGTETETDAAKIPVDQSLSEGKTIAGQTEVASADPDVKTQEKTAETPGLAVTQKMFLYEERLGGSPVAVPGTVTWSLKNDTTNTSGKAQRMVEARIEVPERKLKAVISFKRNSDASLPASHVIELVFDLPADFAEGNVESVQRVAFKQTEQDRGNGLIAVPAKITDDFHMIALNDDADARKVNTELMKTRSWIDIPIVYRNNRRALLTFEKGATGTEAFDKALAEWAALGPTATNN